jgi:aspartyl-tRNA(Asn)/glutamyl-tRNA(Gln) amidotransferase subunit A
MRVFERLGADVKEIPLPHGQYAVAVYYLIATAEASSNLARYDGVHFGHRTSEAVNDIVELFSKSRAEGFGPEVQRRIMIGTYALSAGYADKFYLQALKMRTLIRRDFDEAFKHCDVILSPTSPTPAFKAGEKTADPLAMYLVDVFTVTCNIAGIPGISVPCGFTAGANPLPIGMQLLGPVFSEETLLRAARMFEASTEYHKRRPVMDIQQTEE